MCLWRKLAIAGCMHVVCSLLLEEVCCQVWGVMALAPAELPASCLSLPGVLQERSCLRFCGSRAETRGRWEGVCMQCDGQGFAGQEECKWYGLKKGGSVGSCGLNLRRWPCCHL